MKRIDDFYKKFGWLNMDEIFNFISNYNNEFF